MSKAKLWFFIKTRVSVQGVKSLGGHYACLCRGLEFYEVIFFYYYFSKRKCKYFYTFNHFYSEKSSKRAQLHKSTTAGINVQSPQSVPCTCTWLLVITLIINWYIYENDRMIIKNLIIPSYFDRKTWFGWKGGWW